MDVLGTAGDEVPPKVRQTGRGVAQGASELTRSGEICSDRTPTQSIDVIAAAFDHTLTFIMFRTNGARMPLVRVRE